jgi:hypothetical protein
MPDEYTPGTGIGISVSTLPRDPARCKAGVWSNERWSRYAQCARKASEDGWCKQHHPEAEARRNQASNERYQREMRRHLMGAFGEVFMAALIKIRDGDNDPRTTAANALNGCSYATKSRNSPEPEQTA